MKNCFGLSKNTIELVCSVFAKYPSIEKVVLYGSRAKGNYREGSDIDLTLLGTGIEINELGTIFDELDNLLLPYTFDLSVYHHLKNKKLREHIDRAGKVFYEKRGEMKKSRRNQIVCESEPMETLSTFLSV